MKVFINNKVLASMLSNYVWISEFDGYSCQVRSILSRLLYLLHPTCPATNTPELDVLNVTWTTDGAKLESIKSISPSFGFLSTSVSGYAQCKLQVDGHVCFGTCNCWRCDSGSLTVCLIVSLRSHVYGSQRPKHLKHLCHWEKNLHLWFVRSL